MLTISGYGHPHRRDLLRVGALGVGGLKLADVFRVRARAASGSDAPAKSVIMVCLTGGPSHIDTYDPKPDWVLRTSRSARAGRGWRISVCPRAHRSRN